MIKKDQLIFDLIEKERKRQHHSIGLIASENIASPQVMEATGSILTNKYAEGYPHKRYYNGCQVVDEIEQLAIDRLKKLFGVEWANVQPHSGSQANAAVFLGALNPGDKILGFNLSHGGHLTHGSPVNFSGQHYQASFYGVDPEKGYIHWEKVADIARKEKPNLIICGASTYSLDWDYEKLRSIADEVGAFLLADIAHPAGLIAKGILNNPVPHCHFITSTTHKTLRGPRGGIIMMGKDFENPWGKKTPKGKVKTMSALLDSAVFPGTQGGPLENIIAAKAIAFEEALSDSYTSYVKQVQSNAQALAKALQEKGYDIVYGGTKNHIVLIDLRNKNINGKVASTALEKADIIVNKNMVPFDDQSPFITSGIRLGTPLVTTRGMKETDMRTISDLLDEALLHHDNSEKLQALKLKVNHWMKEFDFFYHHR